MPLEQDRYKKDSTDDASSEIFFDFSTIVSTCINGAKGAIPSVRHKFLWFHLCQTKGRDTVGKAQVPVVPSVPSQVEQFQKNTAQGGDRSWYCTHHPPCNNQNNVQPCTSLNSTD